MAKEGESTNLVIHVDLTVPEDDIGAEELKLMEGHLADLLKQILAERGED